MEFLQVSQPHIGRRVSQAFRAHQRHLWGVAYRLTGSASDADDVVHTSVIPFQR
jgi:DNA-directed RNA polymerase specialized sigma24 family protein